MNSTLIILGAGCSLNSGYPKAAEMLTRLEQFSQRLGDNATNLRKLVEQTLDLVKELRQRGKAVDTLDTLARLIHEEPAYGQTKQQRNHFVVAAKISVAAFFLFLEREAIQKGLPGYRQLLIRVFPDVPKVGFRRAIELSRYRILTFNYDRLFELAFRQYFPTFDGTEVYGPTVLNSGLSRLLPQKIKIDRTKFSFLKFHGSAGFYAAPKDIYPCKKTRIEHGHLVPDLKTPPPITDSEFFYPNDPTYGIRSGKPKLVLITFPHEKDHLKQYPGNLLAFKNYSPAITKEAHAFASQAHEIQILGYSCPIADAEALKQLFAAATSCRRYLIENPSPGDVCQRFHSLLPKHFSGEVVFKAVSF